MWDEVEVQPSVSYGITLKSPCPASLPSHTSEKLKPQASSVTVHPLLLLSQFVFSFTDIYGAVSVKLSSYEPAGTTRGKWWTKHPVINGLSDDRKDCKSILLPCFVFVCLIDFMCLCMYSYYNASDCVSVLRIFCIPPVSSSLIWMAQLASC